MVGCAHVEEKNTRDREKREKREKVWVSNFLCTVDNGVGEECRLVLCICVNRNEQERKRRRRRKKKNSPIGKIILDYQSSTRIRFFLLKRRCSSRMRSLGFEIFNERSVNEKKRHERRFTLIKTRMSLFKWKENVKLTYYYVSLLIMSSKWFSSSSSLSLNQ